MFFKYFLAITRTPWLRKNLGKSWEKLKKILGIFENRAPDLLKIPL